MKNTCTQDNPLLDLSQLVNENTELRKEILSLKMDLAHLKVKFVEARKIEEMQSQQVSMLRRIFKGAKQ